MGLRSRLAVGSGNHWPPLLELVAEKSVARAHNGPGDPD
ncbi:MAG: hypothetical protein QOI36_18, partial [Pseudonocardiales bacterium]|nr:hypothetical protein [Pseudonocardiales bacterium]